MTAASRPAVVALLAVAVAATPLLGLWAQRTLHRWPASAAVAAVLLALAAAPLLLPAVRARIGPPSGTRARAVAVAAVVAFFPAINGALMLNQLGDGSAAQVQRWPILGKHEGRGRGPHYVLDARPPGARAPETLSVDKAVWEKAMPGRSTLVLALHPGAFGIPWFEDDVRVEP